MAKLAFDNPSAELFQLNGELIKRGLEASRKSSRKRMILPIHRTQAAEVQRLINFLQPGSYIRAHKHPMSYASESIILLQGSIRFFTFDENGEILTDNRLSSTPIPDVIDIEPDTWHSFLVLDPDTMIFECKKGPYNAKTDKEFASWAPEEGDDNATEFMKNLAI